VNRYKVSEFATTAQERASKRIDYSASGICEGHRSLSNLTCHLDGDLMRWFEPIAHQAAWWTKRTGKKPLIQALLHFVVACFAAQAVGTTAAYSGQTSASSDKEDSDKWQYVEKIDPITNTTVRSATVIVEDEDAPSLIGKVAVICAPKSDSSDQSLGAPPYIEITMFRKSDDVKHQLDGVSINTAKPVEFRLNGKPTPVSLEAVEHLALRQGSVLGAVFPFSNQMEVSLHLLAAGGLSAEKGRELEGKAGIVNAIVPFFGVLPVGVPGTQDSESIYIPDPHFVIRVPTAAGSWTYVTSLANPPIRKVLTACGVQFRTAPIPTADKATRASPADKTGIARSSNDAVANWQLQIMARIQRAWLRPSSAVPGIECVVSVTQVPGGEVTDVRIGSCNGDQNVRQSIEAAVYRASPLPPPPDPTLFDRNLIITFKPD
jgi:TonB C terminal